MAAVRPFCYGDAPGDLQGVGCLPPNKALKLAITGSAGSGKSTLCRHLARWLDLPLIEELYDEFLTIRRDKPAQLWGRELIALLRHKQGLEARYPGFVSDRCAIDLVHKWHYHFLNSRLGEGPTGRFVDTCLKSINSYDFVVIAPWDSFPLSQVGEERPGVARNLNKYSQLKHHASVVGLTYMWVDKSRIIEIPGVVTEPKARLEFVLDTIASRGIMPYTSRTGLP